MAKKQDELVGISLRIREPLRHRIEQAASRRGVSMNSEISDRLTRSLDDDDRTGSPATAAMFREFVVEIERAERDTGKRWYEDLETAICAMDLIVEAMRRHEPGPIKTDENYRKAWDILFEVEKRKKNVEGKLWELGIPVPTMNLRQKAPAGTLGPRIDNPLLPGRKILPQIVENSKLTAGQKAEANALAVELLELDKKFDDAELAISNAGAPYVGVPSKAYRRSERLRKDSTVAWWKAMRNDPWQFGSID